MGDRKRAKSTTRNSYTCCINTFVETVGDKVLGYIFRPSSGKVMGQGLDLILGQFSNQLENFKG